MAQNRLIFPLLPSLFPPTLASRLQDSINFHHQVLFLIFPKSYLLCFVAFIDYELMYALIVALKLVFWIMQIDFRVENRLCKLRITETFCSPSIHHDLSKNNQKIVDKTIRQKKNRFLFLIMGLKIHQNVDGTWLRDCHKSDNKRWF